MMNYESFLELLKYRRSIRNFKPDPIPDEAIWKILEAGHYAMSGANSQPWEFIVIKDTLIKKELHKAYLVYHEEVYYTEQMRVVELRHPSFDKGKDASITTAWVKAPVIIAVLEDRRKQWGSVLEAQTGGRVLAESMAHCTMLMHLAAASLGLGSQRVDIHGDNPFRQVLKYPEPLNLNILMPIGYRAQEPGQPRRLPVEERVHFDKYDMGKFLYNESLVKYLERIRTLARTGYQSPK
jgi:5,6-dimethylbenzimidazole synthase